MAQKYPPEVGVLRALAAGKVGWVTAAGEWIDNAFDRQAMTVELLLEKDSLTIRDNGEGTATPQDIVQLGKHTAAPDGLGEYGIGGTEALLWAGGERAAVTIQSTHRGTTRRLVMSWLDFARSDWELPDLDVRPAEPAEIGTTLFVRPLQAPQPRNITGLCDELGYLYSHAIRRENRQITIKSAGRRERPRVVMPWEPPAFDPELPQIIRASIHVGNKEAIVSAGVVQAGVPNPRSGLTYWYGYRVVLPHTAAGCGDHSIGRVCGFVELRSGWKSALTRNKNGLVVDDAALFAEVERVIAPVLEAADRAGSTLAMRELSHRLESQINQGLGTPTAKGTRQAGTERGTVTPKGTDRTHKRATQEQAGTRFPGRRDGQGIKVDWSHLGGDKIGDAKPPTVTLNMNNPFIAQAIEARDYKVLAIAVVTLIGDWEYQQPAGNGLHYLTGMEPQSLPELIGRILKNTAFDGKPITEPVHLRPRAVSA
jgi:hypothetical protein